MKTKPSKELLTRQYINKEMSMDMLSVVYNVSPNTLKAWFIEYNIPIRKRNHKWGKI